MVKNNIILEEGYVQMKRKVEFRATGGRACGNDGRRNGHRILQEELEW